MAATRATGTSTQGVTPAGWGTLAGRHVYFGHQSVGYDILAGAGELLRERGVAGVQIIESGDPAALGNPGIVHSKLGSNSDPGSKLQAFANFLAAGAGERAEIAMLKFCYVDIEQGADVGALFGEYERTFGALASRFPRITFVHCTTPLTSRPGGFKNAIKGVLKRPLWGDEQNKRRHEFNERLRAFGGGRVFDIARFESRTEGGAPVCYTLGGVTYPCLNPAYTNDGGHLNAGGKRVLGAALLDCLAGVAARREERR